jgi:peptide/nickel transport system substrate-binding protein
MSNWKKNLKYGATLLASTAILAACGEDLPELEEGGGDPGTEEGTDLDAELDEGDDSTLFIGLTNAPDSFNPFDRPGLAGTWAQRFFYESILSMPTPTEFEPRLGTMETEDNQVFTVTISEDANWTDGEPVTSHDVAFTLNAIADPSVATSLGTNIAMIEGTTGAGVLEEGLDELTGLEIIDDKTIEITTKQPVDLAYISEFLGHNILIAPEHVFGDIPGEEIPQSEAATRPSVFNGAFKFVDYQEEDYLHLEKNEDYHLGEPQIDEVYMRVMSGTALLTEFQAGNLHMAAGGGIGMVSHEDIGLLEEIDGLVVEENPSFSGQYMIINTENERFADPQVRQAIAHALNRELTVENLLHGRGEVLDSTYSSASPYRDESLERVEYDPDLAREMLEEAGFDFEEPIDFVVPTGNVIREQNGDLIEQWLVDIGLTVNQQNYDFTTWLSMAQELDYDLGLMGWGHTVDPNIQTYIYTGASSNNMGYSNPEVDALIDAGNAGTDFDERFPIYQELQALLQEEAPFIPLYSDSQFGVKVDYMEGGIDEYWGGSLHDLHEWSLNP